MVFERLKALIAEQFSIGEDTIFLDTSFIDDLGADSLDAVDLTMAICTEFDVSEADEEKIMDFVTVGDVVRYISNNYD
ncbi:MAG: acyl carrier protein [Oscillospiraceae bacterium]|jgi:acyl carrier protein|nr:acyl carrier protein [Oscillospiraceae bacterium]